MEKLLEWFESLNEDNKNKLDEKLEEYVKVLEVTKMEALKEAYEVTKVERNPAYNNDKFFNEFDKDQKVKNLIGSINDHLDWIEKGYYELWLPSSNRKPAYVAVIDGLHPKYKFNRIFLDKDGAENNCKIFNLEDGKIYNTKENGVNKFFTVINCRAEFIEENKVREIFQTKEESK